MKALEFIFSSFWVWFGFILILSGVGNFILNMFEVYLKHRRKKNSVKE